MFRGQYSHAIDAKGRVALPSRFRESMGSDGEVRLVLTPSISDGSIHVFPLKTWEELEAKVAKLPQFDQQVIMLRRRYVSAAVDCELDSQGRVLVPPQMREHAGILKEVVWAGVLEKIELWAQERWTKATEMSPQDLAELQRRMGEWGL
jgi:MraZ protein